LKWVSPYVRRLVRRMLAEGIREHKGYRYIIVLDDYTHLITIVDKKMKRRHVFLKGR
jgi:hypothetical protein